MNSPSTRADPLRFTASIAAFGRTVSALAARGQVAGQGSGLALGLPARALGQRDAAGLLTGRRVRPAASPGLPRPRRAQAPRRATRRAAALVPPAGARRVVPAATG